MSFLSRVRQTRMPAEARDTAGIPGSERVIAWGVNRLPETTYVVATNAGLYLQGSRIIWPMIVRATWNEPFLELHLQDETGQGQRLRVPISDPSNLPAAVHTQVTANVIVSERLVLSNGCECLAAARRKSDDEIAWTVIFDAGVDPDDPENRAQADLALTELRMALGI